MKPVRPLPHHAPEAFSVRWARASRVRRATFDAPHLARPFRGARLRPLATAPRTPFEEERGQALRRIRALSTVLPPRHFFYGPSAALIWKLPLPTGFTTLTYSGVQHPLTPSKRPGVQGRRFSPHLIEVSEHSGLPVLDEASTWASLGKHLGADDLVAIADALLWEPRNPGGFHPEAAVGARCTRRQLAATLERGQWPGASRLRRALSLASSGSASRPETFLRLRLQEAGLPEPELNADIRTDDGLWLANGDIVFRAERVCVEYQGAQHRTAHHYDADIDRRQLLHQAGWVVVELTAFHVFRAPAEGVRRVRAALLAAGWLG